MTVGFLCEKDQDWLESVR